MFGLPYIYYTEYFLFDSLLFFILHIVAFIIILRASYNSQHGFHVNRWIYQFVKLYQGFFCPIFLFGLNYRFSFCLEMIINEKITNSPLLIISFVFATMNMILNYAHTYMFSIFLEPIFLIHSQLLDVYDGKTTIMVSLVESFVTDVYLFFKLMDKEVAQIVIIAIMILVNIPIYYYRAMTTVHVSMVGILLEITQILNAPLLLLYQRFSSNPRPPVGIMIIIFLDLFFALVIYLTQLSLKKQTMHIFSSWKRKVGEPELDFEITSFIPGRIEAVLRIIAVQSGDPVFFDRFIMMYHRGPVRTSVMLEVIRFLSIFPGRRTEILEELQSMRECKSAFNHFAVYFWIKLLKSYISTSSIKHQNNINILQRSYFVYHYMYWKARSQNHYIESFKYGCAAAYYYFELLYEFKAAMERFPFNSQLFHDYANFCLLASGDFDNYKKYKAISNDIENSRPAKDPIVQLVMNYNPRIMQFMTENETKSLMISSSSTHSFIDTSDHSTNISSSSSKKNQPIAAIIIKSKRKLPFYPIIHVFICILVVIGFFILTIHFEDIFHSSSLYLKSELCKSIKKFDETMSGLFIPFAVQYFNSYVEPLIRRNKNKTRGFYPDTSEECNDLIFLIVRDMVSFYDKVPQINALGYDSSSVHFFFFKEHMLNMVNSTCDVVNDMSTFLEELAYKQIYQFMGTMNELNQKLKVLITNVEKQYGMKFYVTSIIILACIVIFIYQILFMHRTNTVLKKDTKLISYFSSKERLAMIFLDNAMQTWELLRKYVNLEDATFDNSSVSRALFRATPEVTSSAVFSTSQSLEIDMNTNDSSFHQSGENKMLKLNPNRVSVSFTGIVQQVFMDRKSFIVPSKSAPNSDFSSDDSEKTLKHSSSKPASTCNSDDDPIESTIQATFSNGKAPYWIVPLFVYLPWFATVSFLLLIWIPMENRSRAQKRLIEEALNIDYQTNASISLIDITFRTLEYDINLSDQYIEVDKIIRSKDTAITKEYLRYQCWDVADIACTSVASLVQEMIHTPVTDDNIEDVILVTLSVFVLFCRGNIAIIYRSLIDDFIKLPRSLDINFYVYISIIFYSFIVPSLSLQKAIVKGFNSLFHSPKHYNDEEESDDDENDFKLNHVFPKSILVVSSVTENDEIYSISDNAHVVLGKQTAEFICRKMNKLFPVCEFNEDYREFLMPDKKSKKLFHCFSSQIGRLTKTFFIEETKANQPSNQNKMNFATQLMDYLPVGYARSFSDNLNTHLTFTDSTFIILRYKSEIPTDVAERFYSTVHSQYQNYSSINVLRVDGSIMVLASSSRTHKIIPFLFIRDLLNEFYKTYQAKMASFPLISALLFNQESVDLHIVEFPEPFLDFNLPGIHYILDQFFMFNPQNIAFEASLLPYISNKFVSNPVTRVSHAGSNGKKSFDAVLVPFSDFCTEFNNITK